MLTLTLKHDGPMPESCATCAFWNLQYCPIHGNRETLISKKYVTQRHKKCPIVIEEEEPETTSAEA